jgi:hypothetical protein
LAALLRLPSFGFGRLRSGFSEVPPDPGEGGQTFSRGPTMKLFQP